MGTAFSYTVNAFTDAETPTNLTYTATITPANGLSFDPTTRTISGTPLSTATSSVTVTATDMGGLSASTNFNITTSCPPLTASINPSLATLSCTTPSVILTASGGESYRWDDNSTSALRSVGTAGTYSVTVTGANACTAIARATITMLVPPPSSLSLLVSGRVLQVTAAGGILFERVIVIDRINGYEIRQADSNTTGFFPITRTGPYRLTVTDANGCRTTVEGRIDTLP